MGDCRVCVVGAGIAGLTAAKALQRLDVDVEVLEASGRIGGRIASLPLGLPWSVELGAEFIHGAGSCLQLLIDKLSFGRTEKLWPAWHYDVDTNQWCTNGPQSSSLHGSRQVIQYEGSDLHTVLKVLEDIEDEDQPVEDVRLIDWLEQKGTLTHKQIQLAEACFANDFSGTLESIGLREAIQEAQCWSDGDEYVMFDEQMVQAVHMFGTGLDIKYNSKVTKIEQITNSQLGNFLVVTTSDGVVRDYSHVVIAVPHKVLQLNDIEFLPPLPNCKTQAINRIQVGQAIKTLILFNQKFWDDSMWNILLSGHDIPEIWTLPKSTQAYGRSRQSQSCETIIDHQQCDNSGLTFLNDKLEECSMQQLKTVCSEISARNDPWSKQDQVCGIMAFIAGKFAQVEEQKDVKQRVQTFLDLIDQMFGGIDDTCPASKHFQGAVICDWGKMPNIHGAYTYPSYGVKVGDRALVRQSTFGETLFFAGEACSESLNPCMQGAVETGLLAAAEVQAALDKTRMTQECDEQSKNGFEWSLINMLNRFREHGLDAIYKQYAKDVFGNLV